MFHDSRHASSSSSSFGVQYYKSGIRVCTRKASEKCIRRKVCSNADMTCLHLTLVVLSFFERRKKLHITHYSTHYIIMHIHITFSLIMECYAAVNSTKKLFCGIERVFRVHLMCKFCKST
jgi:hypothetical protein